jgi:NAD(P)-dependent dehydrogenase (short-subunit alcohol dehydrogenase family)
MRLKDKIALVLGAARGMGYEIAQLFAREGAITYVDDTATPDRPHSDGVASVHLDVSRLEDWGGAVETILDKHGRIDVLVNNAGIIAYEPLDALDLAARQRVIAICLMEAAAERKEPRSAISEGMERSRCCFS